MGPTYYPFHPPSRYLSSASKLLPRLELASATSSPEAAQRPVHLVQTIASPTCSSFVPGIPFGQEQSLPFRTQISLELQISLRKNVLSVVYLRGRWHLLALELVFREREDCKSRLLIVIRYCYTLLLLLCCSPSWCFLVEAPGLWLMVSGATQVLLPWDPYSKFPNAKPQRARTPVLLSASLSGFLHLHLGSTTPHFSSQWKNYSSNPRLLLLEGGSDFAVPHLWGPCWSTL